MLGQAGVLVLLSAFVGLSYGQGICHNGICPNQTCAANSECPSCFACNVTCGTCETIPNCCMSHQVCPDWNGICDLEVNPTTCNYCEFVTHICKPGCIDNSNCEAGSQCLDHQCKPVEECTDDAYCNSGSPPWVCDIANSPYTTCYYCEGGECKPGCLTNDNCPTGYTCDTSDHMCHAPAGKVLVDSITVWTKTGCSSCSKEGVTVSLLGEKNGNYLDGVPCSTKILDHDGSIDFDGSGGSKATFNGQGSDAEKDMMGGCYQAPLNAQLNGGTLVWQGSDNWEPSTVCVDWHSENFAWKCDATHSGTKTWNLVNCHDLVPKTRCSDI